MYSKVRRDRLHKRTCGNGSTELISLVIQIKKPSKALIVGPTYSEYEHEVALGGGRSHYFRLREKIILNWI